VKEHGVIPDVIDTAPAEEAQVSHDALFLLFISKFIFGMSEIILQRSEL
jgi:hypothetical protein